MYHPVPAMRPDRFAIFTHSLGDHSVHPLPFKLSSAACGGFLAVEISLIDLEHYATSVPCSLLEAAHRIGDLCRSLGLRVSCLQPLRDVVEAKSVGEVVERTAGLFPIMDALDTELLVCCSSFLPQHRIDGSLSNTSTNLRAMGTAAARWLPNPKKIAFEALSWGTAINRWAHAWRVVQAVDLQNVGICLDSFNTLAREWADPTVEGGIQKDADKNLKRSMDELSRVPGGKIFLLQIGDGARLKGALAEGPAERPALMTWSRSSRLFPMEEELGGYLPVAQFVGAVLRTGYDGCWSSEVFNDSLLSASLCTPIVHARRAFNGLCKLENSLLAAPLPSPPLPQDHHHLVGYPPPPLSLQNPNHHFLGKLPPPLAQIHLGTYRPTAKSSSSDASLVVTPTDSSPSDHDHDHHHNHHHHRLSLSSSSSSSS